MGLLLFNAHWTGETLFVSGQQGIVRTFSQGNHQAPISSKFPASADDATQGARSAAAVFFVGGLNQTIPGSAGRWRRGV